MRSKLLNLATLVIVFAAMTTLTRCGSGVGKTVESHVGVVKF